MGWFSSKPGSQGAIPSTSGAGPASQPSTLDPGSRIANAFTVIRLLGEGAFGSVYLCTTDQGPCAVKMLRNVDRPEERQRLRAEAVRWAELGIHPNIVHAMTVAEHARTPCIVMEYVEGGQTLGDLVQNSGGDWRHAIWLGAQVARGLAHAWKTSGLLHRDIKPANILIRPEGRAQIGDFGLATATRTEKNANLAAGVGTPLYMAPEIWRGETVGQAADIYALGVTLYETACARWPYERDQPRSREDVARSHQFNAPSDLRAFAPDVPPAFADLVMRCLNKDPQQRPASHARIASELEQIALSVPSLGPVSLPQTLSISEAARLTNLVGVYLRQGEIARASAAAERGRNLAPHNPKVWTAVAAVRSAEGRHMEARKALLSGLEKSPDADLRFVMERDLAVSCHAAGLPREAEQWLTRTLANTGAPERFALLDGCSNLIGDLLPLEEARDVLRRILAADPNAAITWNNNAVLSRRRGDFVEAERSARQAVKLNPLYAKAWVNLANALVSQDQYRPAVEAAERAISIDPWIGNAYLALHAAYTCLGDDARAMSVLRTGAKRVPNHPGIKDVLKHWKDAQ
jgi:serine/threonine protein kinase